MSHLVVSHISHAYDGNVVLRDVSFPIAKGEQVCLLGPSGVGKTTLLRLIAGLQELQAGEIRLEGEILSDTHTHMRPEERHIGFIFQHPSLFPHLNVADNIRFAMRGQPTAEQNEAIHFWLERIALLEREHHYPHMLSGGEQQRVALVRALAAKPRLLLMDEPFSSLDPQLRRSLRRETSDLLRETQTTVLMVTHDASEALAMGDNVVVLDKAGGVSQQGVPSEVYYAPKTAYAASMIGQVNVIPHSPESDKLVTEFGSFSVEQVHRKNAELLIRPEALQIDAKQGDVAAEVLTSYCSGPQCTTHVRTKAGHEYIILHDHKLQFTTQQAVFLSLNYQDVMLLPASAA